MIDNGFRFVSTFNFMTKTNNGHAITVRDLCEVYWGEARWKLHFSENSQQLSFSMTPKQISLRARFSNSIEYGMDSLYCPLDSKKNLVRLELEGLDST